MRKDFYIFRHGQTDYNKELRIQGSGIDVDLNTEGRIQAKDLAERLENFGLEYIYSSGLKRARQTAEIVAQHLGIRCGIVEDLREVCFGKAEGLLKSEMEEGFPHIYAAWYAPEDDMNVRFPGGESKAEVQKRMLAVIEKLLATPYQRIGVASHGGAIRYLLYKFGMKPHKMPNTALYHLIYDDGKWVLE